MPADSSTSGGRKASIPTPSRLDILLNSTYARTPPYDYEHLVIELKRSSVKLGSTELNQIESYAQTVEEDARFDKQKTKWTWLLIGVECDTFAERRRAASDRPHGLVANRAGTQVWVRTWSEIVSAAKRRYEFFLKQLELELTTDDGLQYLHQRHGPHLPPSLGTEASPSAPHVPCCDTNTNGDAPVTGKKGKKKAT